MANERVVNKRQVQYGLLLLPFATEEADLTSPSGEHSGHSRPLQSASALTFLASLVPSLTRLQTEMVSILAGTFKGTLTGAQVSGGKSLALLSLLTQRYAKGFRSWTDIKQGPA